MEMVNVGQSFGHILHRNITEAVEALSFLVSVQGIPTASQVHTSVVLQDHQEFSVHIHGQSVSRDFQLPSGLDQTPPGLDFLGQTAELKSLTKPEQFVRQSNAARDLAFIHEESDRDL